MAEGFLHTMAGDRYDVFSAGTQPAGSIHPLAVDVMAEAGVNIADQYPKPVRQYVGQAFDWVVTVCDGARDACPVFPGAKQQLHWSFEDPASAEGNEEEKRAVFRSVRNQIKLRISAFLPSPVEKEISSE